MDIKTTVIVSILAHVAFIGSFQDRLAGLFDKKEARVTQVTVDYVFTKACPAPSRKAPPVNAETGGSTYTAVKAPPRQIFADNSVQRVIVTPAKPRQLENKHSAIEKKLKSTHKYVDYYQNIREMIRSALVKNYSNHYREGSVRIVFTIARNGACSSIETDSAKSSEDAILRKIALDSVRDASPFPRFPKEFDLPELSFDLQITFKKQ